MSKKTDSELKQEIESELRWDPKVNSAQIGVSVDASSSQSIEDTTNAAWAAPGVTEVVDHLKMQMTFGNVASPL